MWSKVERRRRNQKLVYCIECIPGWDCRCSSVSLLLPWRRLANLISVLFAFRSWPLCIHGKRRPAGLLPSTAGSFWQMDWILPQPLGQGRAAHCKKGKTSRAVHRKKGKTGKRWSVKLEKYWVFFSGPYVYLATRPSARNHFFTLYRGKVLKGPLAM